MIYRFEVLLRKIRRWVSRSEWLIALLRLPKTKETEKGTKTTTAGSAASNTEEIKEITARFIKYTDPGE